MSCAIFCCEGGSALPGGRDWGKAWVRTGRIADLWSLVLRLIPKLQAHLHMRRNSLPVFLRWLIDVVLNVLDRRFSQFGWPGKHGHGLDVSRRIYQRIQINVSGYVVLERFRWSHRFDSTHQLRTHVAISVRDNGNPAASV